MIETIQNKTKHATWFFIKFCEREEWADQFLAGELFLNTIHHFKTRESSETADRGDPTEATSLWVQPRDAILKIQVPKLQLATVITENDLAAPIQASNNFHEYLHIFCLTALTTDLPIIESGVVSNLASIHKQMRISQKCFRMGNFAVLVHARPFLEQLSTSLKANNLTASSRRVTYYDDSSFSGQIPFNDVVFHKQKRFTYQREWRLWVNFNINADIPRRLSIGRLPQNSLKLSAADFPCINTIQIALDSSRT